MSWCVVAWAGNVVPSPYSAISGYHDGDLVSLTRREVNAQNASMKSARCYIMTVDSKLLWTCPDSGVGYHHGKDREKGCHV